MNLRSSSSVLAILLGISASLPAQSVSFRGKVEDVSGTANQFFVDCTSTALTSAAINLNAFVGQQTQIDGTWNGSATNPSVEVTAIAVVPETFEIGGNGSIGGEMRFAVFGTPGAGGVLVAAVGSGFFPIPGAGVGFLDPLGLIHIGTGTVDGLGRFRVTVNVPNNAALVGAVLFGQGATFGLGMPLLVSNPDCKTVQS